MLLSEFMKYCYAYCEIVIYFQKWKGKPKFKYEDFLKIGADGHYAIKQMLDDYSAMYERGDIDCDITEFKLIHFSALGNCLMIVCVDET